MKDLIKLVDVVAAFKERFAAEQLGEDTSYRPNINCGAVSASILQLEDEARQSMGSLGMPKRNLSLAQQRHLLALV